MTPWEEYSQKEALKRQEILKQAEIEKARQEAIKASLQKPKSLADTDPDKKPWEDYPDAKRDAEEKADAYWEDRTIGDVLKQAPKDTLSFMRSGVAQTGAAINALLHNVGTYGGLGEETDLSRSFLDNQMELKKIADQERDYRMQGTYQNSPIMNTVGEVLSLPTTYMGMYPASAIGTTAKLGAAGEATRSLVGKNMVAGGLDASIHSASGENAGQGISFDDAQNVALASGITGGVVKAADSLIGAYAGRGVSAAPKVGSRGLTADAERALEFVDPERRAFAEQQALRVAPEHQARVIVEHGGYKAEDMLQGAIKGDYSGDAQRAYSDVVHARSEAARNVAGAKDFAQKKKYVEAEYQLMQRKLDQFRMQGDFDLSGFNARLQSQISRAGEQAESQLRGIASIIEDNPNMTLKQLVDIRQDLNKAWQNANSVAKDEIKNLTKQIDDYIDTKAPAEISSFYKQAKGHYAEVAEQEKVIELLNKNTKSINDRTAVNWKQLKQDLESSGIHGKAYDDMFGMAKDLEKRFADADHSMFTRMGKLGEEAPTLASNVVGAAFVRATREMWNYIMRHIPFSDAAKARRVMYAVRESLIKSKDPQDLFRNLSRSTELPSEVKAQARASLKAISAYKQSHPEEFQQFIEDSLGGRASREIKQLRNRMNADDLSATKAERAVGDQEDKIFRMEQQMQDMEDAGRDISGIERRIKREYSILQEKRQAASLARDRHAASSDNFNRSLERHNASADKMKNFEEPRTPSERAAVRSRSDEVQPKPKPQDEAAAQEVTGAVETAAEPAVATSGRVAHAAEETATNGESAVAREMTEAQRAGDEDIAIPAAEREYSSGDTVNTVEEASEALASMRSRGHAEYVYVNDIGRLEGRGNRIIAELQSDSLPPRNVYEKLAARFPDNEIQVNRNGSPAYRAEEAGDDISRNTEEMIARQDSERLENLGRITREIAEAGEDGMETSYARLTYRNTAVGDIVKIEITDPAQTGFIRSAIRNLLEEGNGVMLVNGQTARYLEASASKETISRLTREVIGDSDNQASRLADEAMTPSEAPRTSDDIQRENQLSNIERDVSAGNERMSLSDHRSLIREVTRVPERILRKRYPAAEKGTNEWHHHKSKKIADAINSLRRDDLIATYYPTHDRDRAPIRVYKKYADGSWSGTRDATFELSGNGTISYAYTGGLRAGSGAGGDIYPAIWAAARKAGVKVYPTDGLTNINKFRMSINMLKYFAKHPRSSSHIMIQGVQRGARDLGRKPLNARNAKKLISNLGEWLNDTFLSGSNLKISANTTDDELKQIHRSIQSKEGRGRDRAKMSFSTLKSIRDFFKTGNIMMSIAALGVVVANMEGDGMFEGEDAI